jgi:UPF0271 protein
VSAGPQARFVMDLNADMGEDPAALADGREAALMGLVTSANIACGGHAGDETTMHTTLALATRLGVAAGAHPGYPDRESFGRDSLGMTPAAIEETVFVQVRALATLADGVGCALAHVKPHGALYNDAARDRNVAAAIARGVERWSTKVVLVGLAGSLMLEVFTAHGFATAPEAFADRAYEPDGSLRSRRLAGALIAEPARAAAQAVRIATEGRVVASNGCEIPVAARTLCVHGDTPGAATIAAAVAAALRAAGVRVAPLKS